MRALLDTCAFVWLVAAPERVPAKLRRDLRDAALLVSSVTPWELSIKRKLGRLGDIAVPDGDLAAFVERAVAAYGFEPLPPGLRDGVVAGELDLHHHDPFDRMLVAQALANDVPIVTPDKAFAAYPVRTLW